MARRFNHERAASILVEADYLGDKKTAEKRGVGLRTIQSWRSRRATDRVFAQFCAEKRALFERDWAAELPVAIRACIQYIQEAAAQGDRRSPEFLHSVAGALKICSEVGLTKEVLDARLSGQNREVATQARPVVAARSFSDN
jgi:hypothetical protein